MTLGICTVVSPHVLGGRLRHGDIYRLYQPFVGGIKFILIHGIGLALAAVALLSTLTVFAVGLPQVPMTGVA